MNQFFSHCFTLLIGTAFYFQSHLLQAGQIWDLTQEDIRRKAPVTSYEKVKEQLGLLTDLPPQEIAPDTFLVGGHIVLDSHSLKSYQDTALINLEFEYVFQDVGNNLSLPKNPKTLHGLKIAIDTTPSRRLEDEFPGMTNETLEALEKRLSDQGALVEIFRPKKPLNGASVDQTNQVSPPDFVISLQWNDCFQESMFTFCGGNIKSDELKSERQRARFVQAALTGKCIESARLGACISKECAESKLGAQPNTLTKNSTFGGNAIPVKITPLVQAQSLEDTTGDYQGIMMRNLITNGIYAKAIVQPFPDIRWVTKRAKRLGRRLWIEYYVDALTQAMTHYLQDSSSE